MNQICGERRRERIPACISVNVFPAIGSLLAESITPKEGQAVMERVNNERSIGLDVYTVGQRECVCVMKAEKRI